MDVSIIVVNYDTRALLVDCLRSIFQNLNALDSEVIVVDNASQDGSVDFVRSTFPTVHLIENQANVGFAKACNQAAAGARGDFLLLLNSDTVILDDAIERSISFMRSHPEAGMMGCKLLNPDGSWQPSHFVLPSLGSMAAMHLLRHIVRRHRILSDDLWEVEGLIGAFWLIRRQAWDQVGGLDERFFMYCEDVDYCLRMKQAGWRIYLVPNLQIIHHQGGSVQGLGDKALVDLFQSRKLFYQKYYTGTKYHAFMWLTRLGVLADVFVLLAKLVVGKVPWSQFAAGTRTYFHIGRL